VVADQPASTSVYDVSTETSPVSIDISSTTPTTEPSGGTGGKQPGNRTLYAIFEKLDDDDIGANDYPILSVVNDMLDDRGPVDKDTMYAKYDRWLHHEKAEGREEEEDEDEGRTPKKADYIEAFESLKKSHHGDERYYTREGHGAPKVEAVTNVFKKMGCKKAHGDAIERYYPDWKEDQDED